ncbi:cupin domain-containing protein [Sphingobacterium chuzhouense]|uniref:Cupin domain-containing protein n=1 Tax=Sphingobacterium chuzhouense TaxID=1742264 RepID=A0ABR7XQC9_9SPHI|nr:cupin domain-containing protein [Sphingobacterium chuzhouense]MBD1421365.1 cupin domain-containing protein [Sphingobacterium chuzhouense]
MENKNLNEKEKSNDATPQRPEGERILNAPLVEMDLFAFIDQIKNEPTWADSERNSITIFKSEAMTIVLIGLHENAELKPHKANGTISVQVLEGKIEFGTEDQYVQIEKGQMIALQENLMHSVKASTESFFLLTLVM